MTKRSEAYEAMVAAHRRLDETVKRCEQQVFGWGVPEYWQARALVQLWWRNLLTSEVRYSDTKTMWWRAALRRTLPPSWTITQAALMTELFNETAATLEQSMTAAAIRGAALAARESIVL